jgi:hypothetical protein
MKIWLSVFFLFFNVLIGYCQEAIEYRIIEAIDYDNSGIIEGRIIYQYNNEGILLKNIYYDNNNDEIGYADYIYNSDGFIEKYILKDVMGDYDIVTTYEYDFFNNIIKSYTIVEKINYASYSLKFIENNKIVKIENHVINYYNSISRDEIQNTVYFEYDNIGRRIKTLNENNEIIVYREYNDKNLLETVVCEDNSNYSIKIRKYSWERGISRYDQDLYLKF